MSVMSCLVFAFPSGQYTDMMSIDLLLFNFIVVPTASTFGVWGCVSGSAWMDFFTRIATPSPWEFRFR